MERFAREKRLKPLRTYLARSDDRSGPNEMLAHLRNLKRRGKAISIRKIG